MSFGRRIAVRVTARHIRLGILSATEIRAALGKSFRRQSEEWRRDVWREAAERAAAKAQAASR